MPVGKFCFHGDQTKIWLFALVFFISIIDFTRNDSTTNGIFAISMAFIVGLPQINPSAESRRRVNGQHEAPLTAAHVCSGF